MRRRVMVVRSRPLLLRLPLEPTCSAPSRSNRSLFEHNRNRALTMTYHVGAQSYMPNHRSPSNYFMVYCTHVECIDIRVQSLWPATKIGHWVNVKIKTFVVISARTREHEDRVIADLWLPPGPPCHPLAHKSSMSCSIWMVHRSFAATVRGFPSLRLVCRPHDRC